MKNIAYIFLILTLFFASCENEEWAFPNFEYQTVYFAHQYPVRTITLGEDIFDNSLDNEGKFKIMATTGGIYENGSDIAIDVTVDNSLVNDFLFQGGGNEILAMPDSYYNLLSDQIIIPKGAIIGGVTVELTDAFFADPLAINRNYVIPVRMTNVQQADSILSGVAKGDDSRRGVTDEWTVQPKDFTFYAVKYINPWHGFYLRRGKDEIVGKAGFEDLSETRVRSQVFVENDEVVKLTTHSFSEVEFPLVWQNSEGTDINGTLIFKFQEDGSFTVETNSSDFTVTGGGKFIKKGEKNSWGNQDRDALYLNYEIETAEMRMVTTDTLVMRNRGVTMETFSPVLK